MIQGFKPNLQAPALLSIVAPESQVATGIVGNRRRLPSIDFLKGISCVLLFYAHIGMIWHGDDWGFLFCSTQIILDFLGPPMFIVMSCVGTMISQAHHHARARAIKATNGKPEGIYTADSLLKTAYLFIVAELLNYLNLWNMGSFFVFGMSAVLFMAVFHVLTPVLTRIDWKVKLITVAVLVLAFEPSFFWCYGGMVDNGLSVFHYSVWDAPAGDARVLLYYLFFDIRMQPLLSWAIIALLTSIVFDGFCRAYHANNSNAISRELGMIKIAGFACVVVGIVLSFPLERSIAYFPLTLQVYEHISTVLPVFCIRHTPAYQFYCFGIICVIFNIICKRHMRPGYRFPWEEKMSNFGRMSLTVYIFSFFAFAFTHVRMSLVMYSAFFAVFIIVTIHLFWQWERRFQKAGSIEWLRDQFVSRSKRGCSRLARVLESRQAKIHGS